MNNGNGAKLKNIKIKNINVKTDSSAAFQIVSSLNIGVYNCSVNNYINEDGSVQAFSTLLTKNAKFYKCKASNLQSFFNGNILTPGHTVLGFIPIFCYNIKYDKCKSINLFGSCDDVHGMSIFLNSNITVNNFTAKNIIDGYSTGTGAKATGLEVYGSNIEIYDSVAKNIKGINPQDKQSTGFSCAEGINVKFVRCEAKNVIVTDEAGNKNICLGLGTGFGWAPDPRPMFTFPVENVLYLDCTAKNCQVGFDSWYHINSLWKHIKTINCDVSILNANESTRVYTCNACSECIVPFETVLRNVARGNKFICVCNNIFG